MENEVAVVPQDVRYDLSVARDPKQVLAEAMNAAKALQTVIKQKAKPVIFNGEQYVEYEDWQVLGRFYGVTAKVVSTEYVEIGGVRGFTARAEAIDANGRIVSAAEAMCMGDEEKWSTRAKYEYRDGKREKIGEVPVPLFQLRSMSQTRACAKALRNVLAWVVVMAGFKPSVAEEMVGDEQPPQPAPIKPPAPKAQAANGSVTFIPKAVSKKDGQGEKGPWTKYGVLSSDGVTWYGTFDAELGEAALQAKENGKPVTLTFKDDGRYKTIQTLSA